MKHAKSKHFSAQSGRVNWSIKIIIIFAYCWLLVAAYQLMNDIWCVCIRSIAIIIIGALQFMIIYKFLCCAPNDGEEIFFSCVFLISIQLLLILLSSSSSIPVSCFTRVLALMTSVRLCTNTTISHGSTYMSDDQWWFSNENVYIILRLDHHRRLWRENVYLTWTRANDQHILQDSMLT